MVCCYLTCILVIFSVIIVISSKNERRNIILSIENGKAQKIIKVPANSVNVIQVTNIHSDSSAVLFAVHTHIENVTLSQDSVPSVHNAVTGRNIGLIYKLQVSDVDAQMWLLNKGQKNISALIKISSLEVNDPVPGGCNMEFDTEIAPYLHLHSDSFKIYVEYQHANIATKRNDAEFSCSYSTSYLFYEVFVSFLKEDDFGEDEYFKKIEFMSDLSSLRQLSSKELPYSVHPDTRFTFLLYPNVGIVYNVIAKYTINGSIRESPYIPIATYGCDISDFSEHGCNLTDNMSSKILLFLLSIYGFIVACFGSSFLGASMFFFGFLSTSFVSSILLAKFTHIRHSNFVLTFVMISIVGGLIWVLVWLWLHRKSSVPLLLHGFVFGFLLTATVFYTPLGNAEILINDKNYWAFLSLGTLLVTTVLIAYPVLLSIFSTAIVGMYILLLYYDGFIGTRLSYVILNVIKRAISKNLGFALNDYPFEIKDMIMSAAWIMLSTLAILFQWKNQPSSNHQSGRKLWCIFLPWCNKSETIDSDFHNSQQQLLHDENTNYQTFHI